jgi:hypothetical protein
MKHWTELLKRFVTPRWLVLALVVFFAPYFLAQETTGGIQGTVKDPSGAVVSNAQVVVTGANLVGSKQVTADARGYYRFANLPPGTYTLTAKAQGFETLKRDGLVLEVGHLPTVDLELKIGEVKTVVEVSTEGPLIDTTSNTTLTNIPVDVLQDVPHGTSFQSVIQFAPAARNEPLMGNAQSGNGSGGTSPGNGSNGGGIGFSIGGGADSENSYLVEGQETSDLIGGYSHTNVPMDFIQEVQLKTSGVEAEHGGALGGVVNVIMDKGTNSWHGALFTSFQDGAMNGAPGITVRYNPTDTGATKSWGITDPAYQAYQPVRPHTSNLWPGITIGGPLVDIFPRFYGVSDAAYAALKKRITFFGGFNPEFDAYERSINYGPNGGVVPFSQNTHTDYAYGRIDAEVTQKIRVFGSWLAQDQKQWGENLPHPDDVNGLQNATTGCQGLGSALVCTGTPQDPANFSHDYGYTSPNLTLNFGADITLSNSLVSTTRFGYFFANYRDLGFPTNGVLYEWETNGLGATDTNGMPLNAELAQGTGHTIGALDQNFTHYNASKATQFDEDIAWFHGGKHNTHNVKFGYQLHKNYNNINQGYNEPDVQFFPGTSGAYTPVDQNTGFKNCGKVADPTHNPPILGSGIEGITGYSECTGTYGVVDVNDYGTAGTATAFNHSFFAQDAWTLGYGLTVNFGIRMEKENLPAENQPKVGSITTPINFGWGQKIAPRFGAAWDVFQNGKMKVFGGYGKYYDQMKLNLAISTFGGAMWEQCWFGLMNPTLAGITPQFNSGGQYCMGTGSDAQVNWGPAGAPSSLYYLESQNMRTNPTTCSTCTLTEEGVAPHLKPYQQHDTNFGVDYQINPVLAFEARWDRRRLDDAIEDQAIFNGDLGGETFVIVNPGKGVDNTFNNYWTFLYGVPPDCVANTCPTEQKMASAERSYDGLEFRLEKAITHNWAGMVSYTYSRFRGNYTGLTSSDISDGAGGRNAPNDSRAFDEPYFSSNANGGSSSGLLPTDRPNALKGYVYYDLHYLRKLTTDFGLFQSVYSGTPLTSQIDVGYAFTGQPGFPVDIVNRGKWIDVKQDLGSGAITTSAPYVKRTPVYSDSDFNFKQSYKISESKSVSFDATFTNVWNQHSAVEYWQQIDSDYTSHNYLKPGGLYLPYGLDFYSAAMGKYDYTAAMNTGSLNGTTTHSDGPITLNSWYGKPYAYQQSRNVRFGLHITF